MPKHIPGDLNDDDLMPFGVYEDTPLGEIEDSYWLWFLNQNWCDEWPALVRYANNVVPEDDE